MTGASVSRKTRSHRRPVQGVAAVVGVVFLVVGVLGFIPGVTTHYAELRWAGPHSGAMLFGVFSVSILHNLVHLVLGALGVAGSMSRGPSRLYLLGGGLVYLLLWLYGLEVGHESKADFASLNSADNWLHLGLGAGMILLGIGLTVADRARGVYPTPDEEKTGKTG